MANVKLLPITNTLGSVSVNVSSSDCGFCLIGKGQKQLSYATHHNTQVVGEY